MHIYFFLLNCVCQVFKKEPSHFPFFFECVMEAVLAGEEAVLTLKEQTVLLVFLDHCFNSLVCATILIFNVYLTFECYAAAFKVNEDVCFHVNTKNTGSNIFITIFTWCRGKMVCQINMGCTDL